MMEMGRLVSTVNNVGPMDDLLAGIGPSSTRCCMLTGQIHVGNILMWIADDPLPPSKNNLHDHFKTHVY